MKVPLTVFTPTYNRGYILERCYKSLLKQTNKEFIWEIIDDGSTDNTEEIVGEWIKDGLVSIKYTKKINEGKASAINLSVQRCDTELWFCLDSDDYLYEDAIAIILDKYKGIQNEPDIGGMAALRNGLDNEVMHHIRIPKTIKYTKLKDIGHKYKVKAETVLIFKTSILKNYQYPVIKGEKFFGISYIYHLLDVHYNFLVLQDNLMVCEYLTDGITNNKQKLIRNNPKGYIMLKKRCIEYAPDIKSKIKEIISYTNGCMLDKDMTFLKCILESPSKILTFILYPVSGLFFLKRFFVQGN